MEKEKGSFGIGVSYSSYEFRTSIDTVSVSSPALNMWYRKGISDKMEAHANLWLPMGFSLGIKYQLIGSPKTTGFALSLGLDGGFLQFSGDSSKVSIIDIYVPLYTTFEFSEGFALYIVPKYIPRIMFGDESHVQNIVGGTGGIRLGSKTKFLFEGTYGYILNDEIPVFTTAFGISF